MSVLLIVDRVRVINVWNRVIWVSVSLVEFLLRIFGHVWSLHQAICGEAAHKYINFTNKWCYIKQYRWQSKFYLIIFYQRIAFFTVPNAYTVFCNWRRIAHMHDDSTLLIFHSSLWMCVHSQKQVPCRTADFSLGYCMLQLQHWLMWEDASWIFDAGTLGNIRCFRTELASILTYASQVVFVLNDWISIWTDILYEIVRRREQQICWTTTDSW